MRRVWTWLLIAGLGVAARGAEPGAAESDAETPDESLDAEFLDEIKKKWSS